MDGIKQGFGPVYDSGSKLLILGSFPSVISRKTNFYYGNKQNRFWKILGEYFNEAVPDDVDGKRRFVLKHNIALWDVVCECEIVGSQDATIKNFKVADVKKLLQNSQISFIIINGGTAFKIFEKNFKDIGVPYVKLPSTSPANTRFCKEDWFNAISSALAGT